MITTPIFYVNASPHIGHTHSCILADAISRWYKMNEKETFFCTGTDEHGLKIQEASEKAKKSCQQFCDSLSSEFKDIFQKSECDYDVFIRTTQDKHKKAVEFLWKNLQEKGHIYKSNYSGFYSISDECFIKKSQVKQVKQSNGETKYYTETMQPVEWVTEENYMFKMKDFEQRILHFLRENKDFIVPESRYNEVITFIDLCLV
jgi:methionyl-tRNA synthetase